jgi:hypothetical protein
MTGCVATLIDGLAGGVVAGAVMLLPATPSLARAVAPDPPRAAVVQALTDCRKLTDDTARLACYDKAAIAFDQAETQGQVVVIDREQVKAVRRQAFGFNLPTLHIFDRTTKTEEGLDHVELDIDHAYRNAQGRWVLASTNGAVWRQTDDFDIGQEPHKGSKLSIKNGLLGSFFCKIDSTPQMRCERVS